MNIPVIWYFTDLRLDYGLNIILYYIVLAYIISSAYKQNQI